MTRPLHILVATHNKTGTAATVLFGYPAEGNQIEVRFQLELPVAELTSERLQQELSRLQQVADTVDRLNDDLQPRVVPVAGNLKLVN